MWRSSLVAYCSMHPEVTEDLVGMPLALGDNKELNKLAMKIKNCPEDRWHRGRELAQSKGIRFLMNGSLRV